MTSCFHCGLPLPEEPFFLEAEGQGHPFCCSGCLGAYQLIHAAGLEEFYRRREEGPWSERPEEVDADGLAAFDDPDYQRRTVREVGDKREVSLLLEGLHCAACVWLNEKVLNSLPGVESATVNFSTHRARVRWDPNQARLSGIIAMIRRIGYRAEPYDPDTMEVRLRQRDRDLLYRMGVSGFAAANVMLLSVALYAGYFQGMEAVYKTFFHWTCLVVATPAFFYGGWPFFRGAWSGLKLRQLNMDLPIALGATVTYLYSIAVTVTGVGEIYFDSVSMFLFFLLTGRYLESAARRKAAGATERLLNLTPRTATVIRAGEVLLVPVRDVRSGEAVMIKPGERVPVDGVIHQGRTTVDESMLTGESQPVEKVPGSEMVAGSMNLDGGVVIHATRVGEETVLAQIVRLVESAQAQRPPIQSLADRAAARFVAIILVAAVATFLWWYPEGLAIALENTVALLIITCPCALGLATPAAMVVATGAAARVGILIKGGEVLERLSRIHVIALDKTGTVTRGLPAVSALHPMPGVTADDLLARAAAVERFSEHPAGRAILRAAGDRGLGELGQASWFQNHPGLGLEARFDHGMRRVGRPAFVAELVGGELPPAPGEADYSWVACGEAGRFLGWLGLDDPPKPDAVQAVARLKGLGLSVRMLSGDREGVVQRVAAGVGIDVAAGGLLPGEKEAVVARWQGEGQGIAMVGDGVNDAPALARADVALAVENATDVSVAAADVILLNRRLEAVAWSVELARDTLRVIRQNFAFSLLYNAFAIPLAMAGYVIPIVGAIAMPLSSLVVVGNALRLRRHGEPKG